MQKAHDFPAAQPVFHLESFTSTTATISIAGGSYQDGSATLTLEKGKAVTLENTVDGTRYKLVYLGSRKVATDSLPPDPTPPATSPPASTSPTATDPRPRRRRRRRRRPRPAAEPAAGPAGTARERRAGGRAAEPASEEEPAPWREVPRSGGFRPDTVWLSRAPTRHSKSRAAAGAVQVYTYIYIYISIDVHLHRRAQQRPGPRLPRPEARAGQSRSAGALRAAENPDVVRRRPAPALRGAGAAVGAGGAVEHRLLAGEQLVRRRPSRTTTVTCLRARWGSAPVVAASARRRCRSGRQAVRAGCRPARGAGIGEVRLGVAAGGAAGAVRRRDVLAAAASQQAASVV